MAETLGFRAHDSQPAIHDPLLIERTETYAQDVVDTVREPLLILDSTLEPMRNRADASERLAESIVGVLRSAALRVDCGTDRRDICYAVRSPSLKLRFIALNRAALGRLLTATDGLVKIEYMKRDLLRTAALEAEYRYPRSAGTRLG